MKILIALLLVVNTAWARNEPSLLLLNTTTGHALINQRADEQRALASITKLMTALVALDTGYALERPVPLNRRWSTVLPARSYTRGELMTAMLVKSKSRSNPAWIIFDPPKPRTRVVGSMRLRHWIRFAACKSPLGSPTEKKIRCPIISSLALAK